MAPVVELTLSLMAQSAVTAASIRPSPMGLPSGSSTARVVIRWPTLRTSSSALPFSVSGVAVGAGVLPVGVEAAGDGLAGFLEGVLERAVHQPEPVAIDLDLVLGIDRGDGILAVLDGGQRRLDDDVGEAGGVVAADDVLGVDHQLGVDAVVAEQDVRRGPDRR